LPAGRITWRGGGVSSPCHSFLVAPKQCRRQQQQPTANVDNTDDNSSSWLRQYGGQRRQQPPTPTWRMVMTTAAANQHQHEGWVIQCSRPINVNANVENGDDNSSGRSCHCQRREWCCKGTPLTAPTHSLIRASHGHLQVTRSALS